MAEGDGESIGDAEQGSGLLDAPTRLQCLLCRAIFTTRAQPRDRAEEWAHARGQLDDDGIAELIRLSEAEVSDERNRGRQLDGKTASFAGFSGLVLTIDVALARSVFGLDLGSVGDIVARGGLIVASIALLIAAALSISGVLMPQKYRTLALGQFDDFCGPSFQMKPRVEIHRAMLQSLYLTLAQDRPVNACKARVVKMVATFVLIAFVALTAAALTLAVHGLGTPTPARAHPRLASGRNKT